MDLASLLSGAVSPNRAALQPLDLEALLRQQQLAKQQNPLAPQPVPDPLAASFDEAIASGASDYAEDYGAAPATANKIGEVLAAATQLNPAAAFGGAMVNSASNPDEGVWAATQAGLNAVPGVGPAKKIAKLASQPDDIQPLPAGKSPPAAAVASAAPSLPPGPPLASAASPGPTSNVEFDAASGVFRPSAAQGPPQTMADILAGAVGQGTVGMSSPLPLNNGRISQRFPKPSKKPGVGWTGKENPLEENLLINMDVLRHDPVKLQQASDTIANYPNVTNEMREMAPEERLNAFRDQISENLLYLYDLMPPEAQRRASRWYHGANRISRERADEIGIHPYAAAGTYAGLSPQKDWFQNVYLGDQVLRILDQNPKVSRDMINKAEKLKVYREDPEIMEMLRRLSGKRILDMTPDEQAIMVRLHDETYGPRGSNSGERTYREISPEGDYGKVVLNADGSPSRPAWGSFGEIQKAVSSALSGGDVNIISPLMGEKHKVRHFYNDIVNPVEAETFGDITADTHQIAGGLLRPLSGDTIEVAHGLGSGPPKGTPAAPQSAITGMQGLYPIYADATRNAAKSRDVPVIAMQSTPWEAVRSLFPASFKTAKNMEIVDNIWREYAQGRATVEETRQRIVDAAGGFRPPSW